MKKLSDSMDELSRQELLKIIGSQSISELEIEDDSMVGVNFFFCSNQNPCNTTDLLGCTGTQPIKCM